MSKKLQGNGLFDSSRFMLPEHTERIRRHYIEETGRSKPVLDAQEIELIEQAIVDSYNRRVPVELKVFSPFEDVRASGVVTALNTSLREIKLMQDENDYKWIKLEDILLVYL
ncbi:YolD-like family protein [Paenibacillus sp. FSL K6-1230]|uniref:YolD-like family protein n=1 Tax=Paenibacillus sp. FSL K6-1230 TaxID=2921603 RepID=UPI0030F501DE